MSKYTYKDIIIDPTSEEAKNCIGKRVYFNDSPNGCLMHANKDNEYHCGILKEIDASIHRPFIFGIGCDSYGCIILKKEDPKPVVDGTPCGKIKE